MKPCLISFYSSGQTPPVSPSRSSFPCAKFPVYFPFSPQVQAHLLPQHWITSASFVLFHTNTIKVLVIEKRHKVPSAALLIKAYQTVIATLRPTERVRERRAHVWDEKHLRRGCFTLPTRSSGSQLTFGPWGCQDKTDLKDDCLVAESRGGCLQLCSGTCGQLNCCTVHGVFLCMMLSYLHLCDPHSGGVLLWKQTQDKASPRRNHLGPPGDTAVSWYTPPTLELEV